jgi:hypothetical protein
METQVPTYTEIKKMFVKYLFPCQGVRVRTMVLNATFNNISATVYRGGQFLVG